MEPQRLTKEKGTCAWLPGAGDRAAPKNNDAASEEIGRAASGFVPVGLGAASETDNSRKAQRTRGRRSSESAVRLRQLAVGRVEALPTVDREPRPPVSSDAWPSDRSKTTPPQRL